MQTPNTLPAPTCATHAYRGTPAGSCGACQRQQLQRARAHLQAATAARVAYVHARRQAQAQLADAIAHGLAQAQAQQAQALPAQRLTRAQRRILRQQAQRTGARNA